MRKRTWAFIGGAIVVVLAAGGGVAYQMRAQAIAEGQCELNRAYIAEHGPIITTGDGVTSVALLGDSYSRGDGLTDYADAWPNQLDRGWTLHVDAVGMTGYVNGGYCGDQQFGTRVDGLVDVAPDVLLIAGGLNDTTASASDIADAGQNVLDATEGVATRILVGPVDVDARASESDVDATLRELADENGIPYVSALDWDVQMLPDGLHMTAEGHARYAELIGQALDQLGV